MHLDTPCIYVCIFICADTYICIHRYIIYIHVCVCVCVFVCGCVHVYVHTYRQQRRSLLHKSLAQTLGRFWKRALHKSWVDFAKEPYNEAGCLLQKSPTQKPGLCKGALLKIELCCKRALHKRFDSAKDPYTKARCLLQKSPTQQPGTVWNRALHKTGLFCKRALRKSKEPSTIAKQRCSHIFFGRNIRLFWVT